MKNSKKKILVITSSYKRWQDDPQFNEYFIVELTKRLSEEFNISVLAPAYPLSKREEILDDIQVYRHRQYCRSGISIAYQNGMISNLRENRRLVRVIPFYILFQLIELAKIIKKENIHIIHAHWILPQGLVAVLYKMIFNKEVKILATIHGGDFYNFRNYGGRLLKKFIISRVDCLTVVSRALKNDVHKLISKKNISICSMGIDTKLFTPEARDASLRKELGIRGKFLLFVGSCVEQKGIRYLIGAIKEICTEYPECKLVVIGEGNLVDEMKTLARNTGLADKVCFLGHIEHNKLPAYYATADVFILPSLSEGYSLAAREAVSCGTPAIVTALPVFEEDSEKKLFETVPVKDAHAIAEKVIYILRNKNAYEKEKDNMHQFAAQNYDWAGVAYNYTKILNNI